MRRFMTRKTLVYVGISLGVLAILASVYLLIVNRKDTSRISETNDVVEIAETFSPICTRTERFANKPQYDRALSLIRQRIEESIDLDKGTDDATAFDRFPPELVNCIYVKEEDIDNGSGVEGYFTINDTEIKNNYFPITVDKDYKESDDIVTALLLAHEMTHVQQYLDGTPINSRNECLRSEADAFVTQWMLFGNLSIEEMVSVNARIEKNDFLHPQLSMIANIRELSQKYALPACGFMSRDCSREVLKVQMFKVLFDDEFYRKQCDQY